MYKQTRSHMGDSQPILHHCLYFTANSLARVITRMAETAFRPTGLSPSHAFLVMLVNDTPGIGQKALCRKLHLAPSTVTRFVDTLVYKGYLVRQTKGKTASIFPTEAGQGLQQPIEAAWKTLYDAYADVLGRDAGDELTALIDKASEKLSKQA